MFREVWLWALHLEHPRPLRAAPGSEWPHDLVRLTCLYDCIYLFPDLQYWAGTVNPDRLRSNQVRSSLAGWHSVEWFASRPSIRNGLIAADPEWWVRVECCRGFSVPMSPTLVCFMIVVIGYLSATAGLWHVVRICNPGTCSISPRSEPWCGGVLLSWSPYGS